MPKKRAARSQTRKRAIPRKSNAVDVEKEEMRKLRSPIRAHVAATENAHPDHTTAEDETLISSLLFNQPGIQMSPLKRKYNTNFFRANPDFDEKPRSFLIMFLLFGFVYWGAIHSGDEDVNVPVRICIMTMGVVSLWAVLNIRDGLMVRPHPLVWRVFHANALWYLMCVSALAVAPPLLGKNFVQTVVDEVKPEAVATDFGGLDHLDCTFNASTLYRQLTSMWFSAHVAGWWAKMLFIRDWKLCFAYSITFEFLELSLQFVIPEFKECWWDSVVLDALGANVIGMFAGVWMLRMLEVRSYNWTPLAEARHTMKKKEFFRRSAAQFTPYSWQKLDWQPSGSALAYCLANLGWAWSMWLEVQTFLLMQAIDVPASNWFYKWRQITIAFLAAPAMQEWYVYSTDNSCDRIGPNAWIMAVLIPVEAILVWRYTRDFPFRTANVDGIPVGVWLPWTLFFIMQAIALFAHSYYERQQKRKQKHQTKVQLPRWITYLRWASWIPMMTLGQYYAW